MTSLTAAALALLALLGGLVLLQDRLLYFPEQPPLARVLAEARGHGLAAWPGAGESEETGEYRGLLAEPDTPPRATLLLFHGNAGHAGQRYWYARQLTQRGLRVILAEYPGYGPRPGEPGEKALVQDARETLALARKQFPGPFILAGESLGAAVAAACAGHTPVEGLLMITPWDRLQSIARHHYPWLPVGWLLRDRYDSVANLAGFNGRVAVLLAQEDRIVPAKYGQALFAGLAGNKRLWLLPAADHNDWWLHTDQEWGREILEFLLPP